jgi:hypothetical protein
VAFALALLLTAAVPQPALAHPADMFAQTHEVTLSAQGLTLTWIIYPGPLLAPSIWAAADADADERISQAEAEAWVAGIPSPDIALDETGYLKWRVERVTWPSSFARFQLGDEKIRVELQVAWPAGLAGAHDLRLHNKYEEAISIGWFTVSGVEGVRFEAPHQTNGLLELRFAMPGAEGDGLLETWNSGVPTLDAQGTPAGPQPELPVSSNLQVTQMLTGLVRAEDLSVGFITLALSIALALGAIHALTPGHGKALVAAYLVGTRGTLRHAAALGSIVTITHTGSVIAFGAITLAASRFIVPTAPGARAALRAADRRAGGRAVMAALARLPRRRRAARGGTPRRGGAAAPATAARPAPAGAHRRWAAEAAPYH